MSISYLFVSVHPAQTADPREVTESTNGISEASSISALPGTLPGTLTLTPIYALPGFDLWRFSYTEPDWATNLTGIIHKPEGDGPYPAVVISHGKGGTAEGFSLVKAQTWFSDYISIAPNYTHAANEIGGTGPQGGSPENVKRAIRCLDILESQNLVAVADKAERTIHFRIGPSRAVRVLRVARDLLVEVDGRSRLAGLWFLNVPPFPAS